MRLPELPILALFRRHDAAGYWRWHKAIINMKRARITAFGASEIVAIRFWLRDERVIARGYLQVEWDHSRLSFWTSL